VSLVVPRYGSNKIFCVIKSELKLGGHFKGDLGSQEGVRGNASVICCLKGLGMSHTHAVMCLEVLP